MKYPHSIGNSNVEVGNPQPKLQPPKAYKLLVSGTNYCCSGSKV